MSTMTINGRSAALPDDPDALLIDVVRDALDLTGTKLACGAGVCGACTVLVDGEPVRSCLMFAVQADGRSVRTVEDLAPSEEELHPLQQAFHECHGLQCGFCTPGFLMSLEPVLAGVEQLSDEEIRDLISGNLCRCTGYQSIVDAVRLAAERMGPAPATSPNERTEGSQ